jgi:DNA-directed RNA polymerase subunit RPC12/RpoP
MTDPMTCPKCSTTIAIKELTPAQLRIAAILCAKCGAEIPLPPTKERMKQKTARLEAAGRRAEAFVATGGDLKSPEAGPLGVELAEALNEVGKELGYEILKKIEPS